MNRVLVCAVCLITPLAAICAARAAAPATRPADQVPALLKVLYSDDWRQRQEAQDQLAQVGEDALPGLREFCAATMDVEARTSAEAAIKRIEEDLRHGPTRITLHVKDAALEDVLAELSRQAKVDVGFDPLRGRPGARPPKISMDVDRQPFWLVMKEIAAKTGVGPATTMTGPTAPNSANADMIVVAAGSTFGRLPGQLSGNFYIVPGGTTRDNSARGDRSTATLELAIYIDPKLRVLRSPTQLTVQQAVDENGSSLVRGTTTSGTSTMAEGYMRSMSVPLLLAPEAGTKIARLRGTGQFVVATVFDVWEVPNVLDVAETTHKMAVGACTVSGATKTTPDQVRVQAVIDCAGATATQTVAPSQMAMLQENVRLVDASGRPWNADGRMSSGSSARRELQFTFTRSKIDEQRPGDPAKLIWDIPVEIKQATLTVDLKDVPLPR